MSKESTQAKIQKVLADAQANTTLTDEEQQALRSRSHSASSQSDVIYPSKD